MTNPTPVPGRRRPLLRALTVAPATVYFLVLMLVFSTPQAAPTATPTPSPLTVLHLSGTGGTLRVVAIGGPLGGVTVADNAPSTTDIHDAPGTHQLRISSCCSWTITVVNGRAGAAS